MKVISQSVVKANNDVFEGGNVRKNEDAIGVTESKLTVADGAGGVGILADLWANEIVNQMPDTPFENSKSVSDWIETFWENFYTTNLSKLEGDHWKVSKFDSEGSYATFSALWQHTDKTFTYQSYGDTALFIYNSETETLTIQKNLKSINSFSVNPPLLNWQTEGIDSDDFYTQKITLNQNETLIIATDGIAMYIWGAYYAFKQGAETIKEAKMQKVVDYFNTNTIGNFTDFITELKTNLSSNIKFADFTKHCFTHKALPNDDYTLAFVEL